MPEKIAIIAAHDGKHINPSTWELYAFALKLKGHVRAELRFILVGEDTGKLAENLSSRTGCPVIAADVPHTKHYHSEIYKKALIHLLRRHPGAYVLASHNSSGMDYVPALAIAFEAACITAVEEIRKEGPGLCFVRALFNGKIQADILSRNASVAAPLFVTLRPGALKPLPPDAKAGPQVVHELFEVPESNVMYKGQRPSPSRGSNLARSEVVVSGGRGIVEEENYRLIERLAGIFPRAATGASRPVCDYGWVSFQKQVGVTGTVVSPKLYIACGISGSTQHLEGMRESQFIVAINKDPSAPIFQVADVCIVEDLIEFIPVLVEASKKRKVREASETSGA